MTPSELEALIDLEIRERNYQYLKNLHDLEAERSAMAERMGSGIGPELLYRQRVADLTEQHQKNIERDAQRHDQYRIDFVNGDPLPPLDKEKEERFQQAANTAKGLVYSDEPITPSMEKSFREMHGVELADVIAQIKERNRLERQRAEKKLQEEQAKQQVEQQQGIPKPPNEKLLHEELSPIQRSRLKYEQNKAMTQSQEQTP